MMTEEEKLAQGTRAREAQFVLGVLDPVLSQLREDVINKLKNMARGEHSESKLLAAATELCTLDDIRNRLEQRIGLGD